MSLVSHHLKKYPQMQITDVYKLLYQACMGAEHALDDPEAVKVWFDIEWEAIVGNPDEELYEDISLHHPIYRINLRSAKARDIPPSRILEEFKLVGSEFPKNPGVFTNVWDIVSRNIRAGNITLPDAEKIDGFNVNIIEHYYPPTHHSREYAEAYKPAYRLVGCEI